MKKFFKVILTTLLVFAVVFGGIAILNRINAEVVYNYIDTFSAVEYENRLEPKHDDDGSVYFTSDRDFKVMKLTDIHFCGGFLSANKDKMAINAIAAMVTAEKPDLVIITGDISFAVPWYGTINNFYGHSYMQKLFEKLGVYWTVVFGNHDSESYNFYDRSAVAEMYEDESLKYCLFERGPSEIFGEGNHYINIKNSAGVITRSLVMLDSNAYTNEDPLGIRGIYDKIHDDQIEWYGDIIEKNNAKNSEILGDEAKMVKSSLFIHIPISAVKTAYEEYVANGRKNTEDVNFLFGKDGEPYPVVYSPSVEDGVIDKLVAQGSCDGIFYGHDHLNNFTILYKNIYLSYGYSIDYAAYMGIDSVGSQRGCTVLNYLTDGSFEAVNENYYQSKYVPLYEKESVDMSK